MSGRGVNRLWYPRAVEGRGVTDCGVGVCLNPGALAGRSGVFRSDSCMWRSLDDVAVCSVGEETLESRLLRDSKQTLVK